MNVLISVLPAALLYAWGMRRARRRPDRAAAAWASGLVVLCVVTSPWLERAADDRLSMHMVQHELIGLVVAPLLVAGAPVRLAFAASGRQGRRRLAALLRHPLPALLVHPAAGAATFAVVLAAVHVPAVYDLSLRVGAVHGVVHAALLWSAILLWVPLIGVDPLPHRPSAPVIVGALLAAMAAMGALGATIAGSDHVLYDPYAARSADALADQRVAGGLMWMGGLIVLLPALLALAWRALVAEERRAAAREARATAVDGAR